MTFLIFVYSLILGHIIGDFVLQSFQLVQYKERSKLGIAFHSVVVAFSVLVTMFLLGLTFGIPTFFQTLFATLTIFASHFFIDLLKVSLTKKTAKIAELRLPLLAMDQLLHTLFFFAIAFFLYVKDSENFFSRPNIMVMTENKVLFYLAAYLFVAVAGSILVFESGNTFSGIIKNSIDFRERLKGIVERSAVVTLFLFGFFWVSPAVFIPGIFLQKKKDRRFWIEQSTSFLLAVVVGLGVIIINRYNHGF